MSAAFARLEEGYENALKDYYKKQIGQLNMLIACLLGSLNKGERQKVMMPLLLFILTEIFFFCDLTSSTLGDDNLHDRRAFPRRGWWDDQVDDGDVMMLIMIRLIFYQVRVCFDLCSILIIFFNVESFLDDL